MSRDVAPRVQDVADGATEFSLPRLATYAVIDLRARTMTYARAGHTPLIYVPGACASGAERQVQIRRLNFRRDTLEDIFLKAMETRNGRL